MTTSGTTSDSEWQRVTTSGKEWQQVTTNDKEWQRMTKRNNKWQGMITSGTRDSVWQRATISANFSFYFQVREKSTTKHPKENSLNLEEDLWRRPIELRAETSTQEEILTVRSRNCISSCSQIFIKISVLKIFAIFTGKQHAIFCNIPFLRKLKPASLLKGDSNTGVFLWILRNF